MPASKPSSSQYSKMLIIILLSFIYMISARIYNESHEESERDLLIRKERWVPLVYPRGNPTRLQFIGGFGIPVEHLSLESITTGYVLKADYYLPYKAKQWRTKNVHSITARKQQQDNATIFEQLISKSDEELGLPAMDFSDEMPALSSYRWAAYKRFEDLATRMQLNGRECVLKSICESAMVPFDGANGLLGELLHILLTPSSSKDPLSLHTDNDYLQAEHLGRAGADCNQVYAHCAKSLLEHFSDVHDLGSDILKMFG